jgi:uncharacterized protein YbjT (DUF2867 family)
MPARHDFRPNRDFTPRAARPKVAAVSLAFPLAPLVIAGGSNGTGLELARLAGATGREARIVDDPAPCAELRAALDGAEAVALIPARTVGSLAAQVKAVLDTLGDSAGAPQVVLVTGFSIGHGLEHALNTPERLADRRRAESLVRASGVPYTIVRPTWLTSDPPGHYAITLTQDPLADGMIARTDLAAVCLAAVSEPAARGTTFAVFAQPGPATRSWASVFAGLKPDAPAVRGRPARLASRAA